MDGFTPQFFLQVLIAVGGIVGAYWAVRSKLEQLDAKLTYHVEKEHPAADARHQVFEQATDNSIHDLRDGIGIVSTKVAILEGKAQR